MSELSVLQTQAFTHSWAESEKALEEYLGPGWSEKFQLKMHPNQPPIGSGCIASVYRGSIRGEPGY